MNEPAHMTECAIRTQDSSNSFGFAVWSEVADTSKRTIQELSRALSRESHYISMISSTLDRAVSVNVANPAGEPKDRKIPGLLEVVTPRYLTLSVSQLLPAKTAVSVQFDDTLFVGEVVNTTSEAPERWETTVKVVHTLSDLAKLSERVLEFNRD